MRITMNLDEELLEEAGRLSGVEDRTALIHAGLRALIERESARHPAKPDEGKEGHHTQDEVQDSGESRLDPSVWLDDQVDRLDYGDTVHAYNCKEHNGSFLGMIGVVDDVRGDTYDVTFVDSMLGTFVRSELELLEDHNPRYRDDTSS